MPLFNYDKMAVKYKGLLIEFAMLVACAVVAIQGKKEDDLSEHEARELYGRQWLTDRTQRGMIHFTRNGATEKSAKMYSRLEIEAMKLSEKGITEYVKHGEDKVKEAVERLKGIMK